MIPGLIAIAWQQARAISGAQAQRRIVWSAFVFAPDQASAVR